MKMNISAIISKGERVTLECKKAQHSVPNSLWDTYSAFANTYGGTILLEQVKLSLYFDKETMFGPTSDPKDDLKSLTKRQMEILNLIQENNGITREEIASILRLSESTIKREIAILKEKAILTREGGRYSGHWLIKLQG